MRSCESSTIQEISANSTSFLKQDTISWSFIETITPAKDIPVFLGHGMDDQVVPLVVGTMVDVVGMKGGTRVDFA